MSKYSDLFDYMRTCPALADLWSIGATENMGVSVILPQGASEAVAYKEKLDVYGNYEGDIIPYPSVFEDFQINCFRFYDNKDSSEPSSNINVMSLDEVQGICDWVVAQNNIGNLPEFAGQKVISIECNPFVPQIRYVNEQENIIAYFITVRVRYVNPFKQRQVEYECSY